MSGFSFAAGGLEAVAYRNGKQVSKTSVVTAGEPSAIALTPDRKRIDANPDDLAFVTVRIVDAGGHVCPLADNLVQFEIAGEGELAAVGNGNAATTESFQASHRKAFQGMCLAIVRAKGARRGGFTLKATARDLKSAEVEILADWTRRHGIVGARRAELMREMNLLGQQKSVLRQMELSPVRAQFGGRDKENNGYASTSPYRSLPTAVATPCRHQPIRACREFFQLSPAHASE